MILNEFLDNVEQEQLTFIVQNTNISNTIMQFSSKDITTFRYCDVIAIKKLLMDGNVVDTVIYVYNTHNHLNIKYNYFINKCDSLEFVKFLAWIISQIKTINELELLYLQGKTDAKMEVAGIGKLNEFEEQAIYYSIDKNPVNWKAISELPYYMVFSSLAQSNIINDVTNNMTNKK